jgi:transposase
MLLGSDQAWLVESAELLTESKRVVIVLEHAGGRLKGPECGASCNRTDTAPERTWRHRDTMQFETTLKAGIPSCWCQKCGLKTVEVPRAGKHLRFTLMFEAFAICVLQDCSSVKQLK